ncbi:MAG: rRNA maturation RNase YbeY [Verrucomicrobiota bacterium]
MTQLCLRNRQRTRKIDLRLLRKITLGLLKEILREPQFELGIHLVAAKEMAMVNENFLHHRGSTDVITFDYGQRAASMHLLHGEIFISIDDAVSQAKEFRATWQSELIRYVVHGILHLKGFDDLLPSARHKMKREENRLLTELSRRFTLSKLQRKLKK